MGDVIELFPQAAMDQTVETFRAMHLEWKTYPRQPGLEPTERIALSDRNRAFYLSATRRYGRRLRARLDAVMAASAARLPQ